MRRIATGEPHKISTAFLKAATNGSAPLFVRERLPWYATDARRAVVMEQAERLFRAYQEAGHRLGLQWIDLSTLAGRTRTTATKDGEQVVHTCAGRAVAWLEDPEGAPEGLAWVEAGRPHRGCYVQVAPIDVTLAKTPHGLRVVGLSTHLEVSLRKP